ncbi:F-box domain-containing protein [Aspergillus sclerotialis]|uniref:F-box domain-containing protein n=1 Tax=Aspergillus sclerotialis TaxID=2070753 RepID=A0A3A2ZMJ9_9EURO|nr:F-box domain-containing protein [Aspergillus sclerotialis]
MTETGLFADSKMSSDLDSTSDEEFVSSASTASGELDEQPIPTGNLQQHPTPLQLRSKQTASSTSLVKEHASSGSPQDGRNSPGMANRRLHLLDLPMDILKEIIKEVGANPSALACSALHSLAIPHMYSRFDIVWPDTISSADHPAGVDALSYGLATLVMGENVFHELPNQSYSHLCPHCGCNEHHLSSGSPIETVNRRVRRGNYYAQYTRKFSVGNGPIVWVQEYSVTKETGKMLGTLVALAVARMVNLESFIWDMPTGVLRDVWIALASLADRPGRECRLEKVWVRWHDNSEHLRTVSSTPVTSSLALPGEHSGSASANTSSLFQRYGHVEYPNLSLLPPLKSLSVLDIDEPSYIEEMGVLVDRSWDRLKELRIGISLKVYKSDWLKPIGDDWSGHQEAPAIGSRVPGWPRVGGVLGILSKKSKTLHTSSAACEGSSKADEVHQISSHSTEEETLQHDPAQALSEVGVSNGAQVPVVKSSGIVNDSDAAGPASQVDVAINIPETKSPLKPSVRSFESSSTSVPYEERAHRKLRLETLELERVHLSIPVMLRVFDWTRITRLTILRCEEHEKLWRSLRRHYTPSASLRPTPGKALGLKQDKGKSSPGEFPLRIKHLHTDAVSHSLLLFIKDAIAPNTLENLILQEAPLYESIVTIDAIYRNVIRKHRLSLRKLLVDSSDRFTSAGDMHITHWRRWIFTREIISFITSGRMPQLRELGMVMDSKDWHFFLQRLPCIPQLRALYIPHINHHIYGDPKELALQILDVVSIRPDVGITYLGIQSKCYEILEKRNGDKDEEFDGSDSSHSGVLHPSGGDVTESENDDDSDEDIQIGNTVETQSVLSADETDLSDGEDSESDISKPQTTFRLREILFYDDKITIFKARHGVL